jgi:peptidoglycan/LPS O-acetylase OafA/YrhL
LLAGWIAVVVWMWFWPIVTATEAARLPEAGIWAAAKYFVSYFNFYFFAGLLAGYVYSVRSFSIRVSCGLLFGGLGAIALQLPWTRWGDGYGIPLVMLLSAVSFGTALLGMAGMERAGALQCGAFARRLGAISYPLYILHTPLLLVIDLEASGVRMSTTWLYVLTPFVLVALTLISAAVAFWIDQPLQRTLRRVTARL